MAITVSTLIAELRREYGDQPKSIRVSRQGNASINLFNTGKFPILENSFSAYVNSTIKTENTDYSFDLDNGDLKIFSTPGNGIPVTVQGKYAHWRDKNYLEAICQSIENLNARGYYRQIVRATNVLRLSAGIQKYNAPSACIDLYEFLIPAGAGSPSAAFIKPNTNWTYQQDANVLVLDSKPSTAMSAAVSYLRRMKVPSATTMTLDVLDDWKEPIKKKVGELFYRSLAAKIAKQGNATVDEGHFSFTNLRTMANDLAVEYNQIAARMKPTRPAKDFGYNVLA
jgi:hypothetical protein